MPRAIVIPAGKELEHRNGVKVVDGQCLDRYVLTREEAGFEYYLRRDLPHAGASL